MSTLTALPSLFDHVGDEPTLDEAVVGAWEGLIVRGVVSCPVCGEEMKSVRGADSGAVFGVCDECGSAMS